MLLSDSKAADQHRKTNPVELDCATGFAIIACLLSHYSVTPGPYPTTSLGIRDWLHQDDLDGIRVTNCYTNCYIVYHGRNKR